MELLHPPNWVRPRGYANGVSATGRAVFVSGMIGWDAQSKLVEGGIVCQVRQALKNIVEVLAEAGAKPEHIVRLNWYVMDKGEYIAAYEEIGTAYREIIGRHYPAMTALQVAALFEDGARVEIEATAMVPQRSRSRSPDRRR